LVTLAALLVLSGFAAVAQNVRITWIGQAGFMVQTDGGATVVADPPSPNLGYPIPEVAADVVTVSHNHGDHSYTAGVRGNFTLVDGRTATSRTQVTAGGMPFVVIPGFHDAQGGAVSGQNSIVQWTQGGLRFAHFGDYGQEQLTDAQLADLQNLDVLMIPGGGYFTVETEEAAALVAQLKPRVTILMHYRTSLGGPAQAAVLPAVPAPFSGVVYKPASAVLNRDRMPTVPEVWVMEPLASAVVVNSGGLAPGIPVAPGSLATIFGTFPGSETLSGAPPLPRRLGQTEVFIGASALPLLYVSPGQINVQIPSAVGLGQFLVEVKVGGQTVSRAPVTVVARAPGIIGAFNADGRVNSAQNRARRGDTLQIYATGQGLAPGIAGVADGAAAGAANLTRSVPEVALGGRRATVRRSGLLQGAAGVWQVTITVPNDAPTGSVPLAMRLGQASNTVLVAIE
jgi:uncharacterized protein (TIGR03437 family)